jgi:hypothetical protein
MASGPVTDEPAQSLAIPIGWSVCSEIFPGFSLCHSMRRTSTAPILRIEIFGDEAPRIKRFRWELLEILEIDWQWNMTIAGGFTGLLLALDRINGFVWQSRDMSGH